MNFATNWSWSQLFCFKQIVIRAFCSQNTFGFMALLPSVQSSICKLGSSFSSHLDSPSQSETIRFWPLWRAASDSPASLPMAISTVLDDILPLRGDWCHLCCNVVYICKGDDFPQGNFLFKATVVSSGHLPVDFSTNPVVHLIYHRVRNSRFIKGLIPLLRFVWKTTPKHSWKRVAHETLTDLWNIVKLLHQYSIKDIPEFFCKSQDFSPQFSIVAGTS